jgi:hypothetical protein
VGNKDTIHKKRTAQIGRAKGMIWMVSVTAFFACYDLYFARPPFFPALCICMIIAAITSFLLKWSIKNLRLAKKLPGEKPGEAIQRSGYARKWFLIILIVEIVGFNIAPVVLWKLDHLQYIVPVVILIAALHFIPLGRIFAMPVYYSHGIILSLICILTMLLVPVSLYTGNLPALMAIPTLGFIFLNWIIIIYILQDAMKYLEKA